jgi:predicted  nucleic acid-binding Zn-ribbon protein
MRSIEKEIVGLNMKMQDAKASLAEAKTPEERDSLQGKIDYCLSEIRSLQEERQQAEG